MASTAHDQRLQLQPFSADYIYDMRNQFLITSHTKNNANGELEGFREQFLPLSEWAATTKIGRLPLKIGQHSNNWISFVVLMVLILTFVKTNENFPLLSVHYFKEKPVCRNYGRNVVQEIDNHVHKGRLTFVTATNYGELWLLIEKYGFLSPGNNASSK